MNTKNFFLLRLCAIDSCKWILFVVMGLFVQASGMAYAADFSIKATPTGTPANLTLSVNIQPDQAWYGKPGSFFIAAKLGNLWFYPTQSGWQPWNPNIQGQTLPPYQTTTLQATNNFTPIVNMDVSTYPGAIVYAGYGSNAASMINAGTYNPVYVVPETGTYRGTVQSGGTRYTQPLAGVVVTLFNATEGQPIQLAGATTDAFGNFTFPTPIITTTNSTFYAVASLAGGVDLVTILGQSLPSKFTINELTTVGAAYSMAQFYKSGVIAGMASSLQIASGMNDNIVSSLTGASSQVLMSSPNADQTNSLRTTRSLANLIAGIVANPAYATQLFSLITPPGGSALSSTTQALAYIARNPGQNVNTIYSLSKGSKIYYPSLETIPDAWTVAVKINNSGNDNMLIGGPGNIVFDANGYAWVTNNVVQGAPSSAQTLMVFKPNGQPADGSNGTPKSPIIGGGILGGGFGICLDQVGTVWEGNFGWGGVNPSMIPPGNGSVSRFMSSGQAISVPNGYFGGVYRAQGMASDANGNIWIASYGNDSVVVFPNGDPARSIKFQEPFGSSPFDIGLAEDGTAWVVNSGEGNVSSSIMKLALVGQTFIQQFQIESATP